MKKTVKILIMIGLLILALPCEVFWFFSIPIALFLFWKRYWKEEDRNDFLLSASIGLILCFIGSFMATGLHHSTPFMLSIPIFWVGYCFLIFPVKKENLKQIFSFSNPATKTKKIIVSCISAFYVLVCFVGGSPMVPNQDEVLSADAPVAETLEEKKSEAQLPEEKDTPEPAEAAEPAPVQTQPEPAEITSTDLFEDVYVQYASRKNPFDFSAVKAFAEASKYTSEIVEETKDMWGHIKLSDANGDYVYFSFFADSETEPQHIMSVTYFQEGKNREVVFNNYSPDSHPDYNNFQTLVLGESNKSVDSIDKQRIFLFQENSAPSTISSNEAAAPSTDGFQVDWEKCIETVTTELTNPEYFDFVDGIRITVNDDTITFIAALKDGTAPAIALDFADTLIRRFNSAAHAQDSTIESSSKDYLGGILSQYNLTIGVAPKSSAQNLEDFYVYDSIVKGVRYHTLKLQPKYTDVPTAQAPPASTSSNNPSTPVEPSITPEDSKEQNVTYVWVTATGKKYHRIPNCGRTKSAREVTLQEAQSMGLTSCSKC